MTRPGDTLSTIALFFGGTAVVPAIRRRVNPGAGRPRMRVASLGRALLA